MGIIQYILDNAARFPEKTALILSDDSLTYSECVEKTRKLSAAFSAIGICESSHIGLLLNNSFEFVITLLAAAELGATVVPLNSTISYKDLSTAIDTTDIDYIIGRDVKLEDAIKSSQLEKTKFPVPLEHCIAVGSHVNGCHNFENILETASDKYELGKLNIDEEQDYILTMTSGSTSAPKPIVFTQGTKIRRCFSAQDSYDLTDEDTVLVATPLYHSISQRLILTPLILGATCVIMRSFSPRSWLEHVNKQKVSFTIAVASQLEAILEPAKEAGDKLTSLRCVVSCCALLNMETKKLLTDELQCDFHECYGISEAGVISNLNIRDLSTKIHSVGRAVSDVDIKIVDNKGNTAATETIGEITCKSAMQFSRYYKNEQATQQSLRDGFLYTGDMGYLDEDGYLVFSGRKKEVIITGGANVFPKDIEAVLIEHPQVKECAVIGVADKHFGEAVLALIIVKDDTELTERDLQRYCLHRLADVQKPLAYVFVDDFPRTSLGKTIKHMLQQQYADYDATANLRAIIQNNSEPQ